tara:strand:- start:4125 stop:5042 length:918 start_codon:yes stop_codon:yes gene_type:complete
MEDTNKKIFFQKVAIIGLGLLGSSIAKGIKKKRIANEIIGYAKTSETRKIAKELGYIDRVESSAKSAVLDADFVILCAPVGSNSDIIKTIKRNLKRGSIITDVGSVKGSVIDDIDKHLPKEVIFIPAHPIAGTEFSGPESGFAELFENKCCLLTPYQEINKIELNKVICFWEALGMFVEIMTPEQHDLILAIISHIPHLVAYNIVNTASELEKDTKTEITKFAGGGFLDYTRIASSDPVMWRDIFLNNREAVIEMLDKYIDGLTDLRKDISSKRGDKLEKLFKDTREKRNSILRSIENMHSKHKV